MFQPTSYASGIFTKTMPQSPFSSPSKAFSSGSLGCTSCSGMGATIDYGKVLQAMQPYVAQQQETERARTIKYGLIGVGVLAVGAIVYLAVKK